MAIRLKYAYAYVTVPKDTPLQMVVEELNAKHSQFDGMDARIVSIHLEDGLKQYMFELSQPKL